MFTVQVCDADPGSEFDLPPKRFRREPGAIGCAVGIAKWFAVRGDAPREIAVRKHDGSQMKLTAPDWLAYGFLYGGHS